MTHSARPDPQEVHSTCGSLHPLTEAMLWARQDGVPMPITHIPDADLAALIWPAAAIASLLHLALETPTLAQRLPARHAGPVPVALIGASTSEVIDEGRWLRAGAFRRSWPRHPIVHAIGPHLFIDGRPPHSTCYEEAVRAWSPPIRSYHATRFCQVPEVDRRGFAILIALRPWLPGYAHAWLDDEALRCSVQTTPLLFLSLEDDANADLDIAATIGGEPEVLARWAPAPHAPGWVAWHITQPWDPAKAWVMIKACEPLWRYHRTHPHAYVSGLIPGKPVTGDSDAYGTSRCFRLGGQLLACDAAIVDATTGIELGTMTEQELDGMASPSAVARAVTAAAVFWRVVERSTTRHWRGLSVAAVAP